MARFPQRAITYAPDIDLNRADCRLTARRGPDILSAMTKKSDQRDLFDAAPARSDGAGESETDPLLFGEGRTAGIVAVEPAPDGGMLLYLADGDTRRTQRVPFSPWLLCGDDYTQAADGARDVSPLNGKGRLNRLVTFDSWAAYQKAHKALAKAANTTASAPTAPFYGITDPVQQYLMQSGETLFKDMTFEEVRRLQVDIECLTTPGYDFCNADREGDAIIAIALADSTGWQAVLASPAMPEAEILAAFVQLVQERNPDVIEGHNLFNFDLPYIQTRAKRHGVRLKLGRDGSRPVTRASRFGVAERTISYTRFEIHGRHVVDTLFLAQAYDVSHRALESYGLKAVAVHFGVAAPERTYIEGAQISEIFHTDPERLLRYVADDVIETRAISDTLSRSSFAQCRMLPFNYQNVTVRGNATKIDALLIRAALAAGRAVPLPDMERAFEGGYTDMFESGVVTDVHHCDVRSLYPSLMLAHKLGPASDEDGVFLNLLARLRDMRLAAKRRMQETTAPADRHHWDALQAAFKILINSFYGYLGFRQGHYSDFGTAAQIAAEGRELLRNMIDWLRRHGARPIEIDTDGIYYVPPDDVLKDGKARDAFRQAFADSLPDGIEIEFDGEYVAMYSYKMKNYALLDANGELVIKGAALKSRGLEPFQRDFLRDLIRAKLEQRPGAIKELRAQVETAIRERQWDIRRFGKTETLNESPESYRAKLESDKGARRSAVYELALKSERRYRAGDPLTYYVTGHKKQVPVVENAKLIADWDPNDRDENVPYYLAKLDALAERFGESETVTQGELF